VVIASSYPDGIAIKAQSSPIPNRFAGFEIICEEKYLWIKPNSDIDMNSPFKNILTTCVHHEGHEDNEGKNIKTWYKLFIELFHDPHEMK
jgi:hypothetical protein